MTFKGSVCYNIVLISYGCTIVQYVLFLYLKKNIFELEIKQESANIVLLTNDFTLRPHCRGPPAAKSRVPLESKQWV